MKKLFLVRMTPASQDAFVLAKGDLFESIVEGLALVRLDKNNERTFKGLWSLIDIQSGLFVLKAKTQKKLLEAWEGRMLERNWKTAIEHARETSSYKNRIKEMEVEVYNWRTSGYNIFWMDPYPEDLY